MLSKLATVSLNFIRSHPRLRQLRNILIKIPGRPWESWLCLIYLLWPPQSLWGRGSVWVRLLTAPIFRCLKGRGQTSLWNSDVSSRVASLPFLIFSQPFNYCPLLIQQRWRTYCLVCVAALGLPEHQAWAWRLSTKNFFLSSTWACLPYSPPLSASSTGIADFIAVHRPADLWPPLFSQFSLLLLLCPASHQQEGPAQGLLLLKGMILEGEVLNWFS